MYINRMLQEHRKLRDLGANLLTLVASDRPCDLADLARRRWELARTVHQHLAYEEQQLFPRLNNDPRPEVRSAGALNKRGIEQLHAVYKAHIEHWTNDEILSRWCDFQSAVRALVARMNRRLEREEKDLFPLLSREEIIERNRQPGFRNWAGDAIALQSKIRGVMPPLVPAESKAQRFSTVDAATRQRS